MKNKGIWFLFFLSKLFYLNLALFVYSKFTTLGDTFNYLRGDHINYGRMIFNSTNFIGTLAGTLAIILGPFLANIPFLILSFYGIYFSINRLKINRSQLIFLLLLLSLPNFGIWTSIASKEALGVFFMGIILGYILDVIERRPSKNIKLVLFSFYLCVLFKPQYLLGIISLLCFIFLSRRFELKGGGKSLLLLCFFCISFLSLYIFRNQINDLSFIMPLHFSLDSGSTRENTIWLNDFDVFRNAPYGMFIGFFGPTLTEAISKPTHLLAFLESSFIIGLFFFGVFRIALITLKTGFFNVYYLGIFLTSSLWILFVHYPFGVLNPGSAIRYRENFYSFFVILFYFIFQKIQGFYSDFRLSNERIKSNSTNS